MLDTENKRRKEQQKQKVKKRYSVTIDPENYLFIPAKKQAGYYDNDVNQRVAIYVRVSTDDVRQTTSYELQKKYYEEFVTRHPNWTLVKIYADEGISGTSLKKRDEFNRMIADCRAGKIDMIITKSVSRFARNVEDFIGTVRNLAELKPRVGVFFESEAIFSLNDDSQMALTFQATMAEEESHIRSRSMETSLRMRLDHGIPLTPKLFGYTHDEDGELQVNPEEAPTVKLMFYMYLYGYSTQQIADTLIAQARPSYFGKLCWTASGVASVLRNERHCGDVLTRKTYTENYRTHRTLRNYGEKPQSRYFNHHAAIVSRDDFNAVQRMLDNAFSASFGMFSISASSLVPASVYTCVKSVNALSPLSVLLPHSIFKLSGIGIILLKSIEPRLCSSAWTDSNSSRISAGSPEILMLFITWLGISCSPHNFVLVVDRFDFLPDSSNDRHRYAIAGHFIQVTVLQSASGRPIELFIGISLQTPAFNGHQLSDSASVQDSVSVLSGDRKHRLVRLLDPSALLTHLFSVGCEDRSRRVLNQHGGVFASVFADAGILTGGDASGNVGNDGIGIHVYEIQTCFAAPAAAGRCLSAGYSVGIINPLALGAADKLPEMRRIAAADRKYLSGTSGIKISDNIQAPSLLGDSEISAVMHTPFKMIPHFNKCGVDGFKRLAPVMR